MENKDYYSADYLQALANRDLFLERQAFRKRLIEGLEKLLDPSSDVTIHDGDEDPSAIAGALRGLGLEVSSDFDYKHPYDSIMQFIGYLKRESNGVVEITGLEKDDGGVSQ
jgi:hypothetical protein